MAEEPRPADQQAASQPEVASDKPRVLGGRPGSPRILQPVEESEEAAAEAVRKGRPEARPSVGQPATRQSANPVQPVNDVPHHGSNSNGSNGTSAEAASVMTESLRASRVALEGLLAKTHEIHEENWRAMQSLFENLHQKLSDEHKARVAGFEKEVSDRGRYQTSALLEKIDLEAESRLAARLDRALDKAREAERQSVRSLEEKVAAIRASLIELTNTATGELYRQKTACLAELQNEVRKRLSDLKIEQANYLENMAKKTADSLSEQFAKRSALAAEAFQKRLQKLAEEIAGQWEKKLAALADGAVASISKDALAVVSRETSNQLIQALHKRLDELANSLND